MKKTLLALTVTLATGITNLNAQIVNIPDANFKAYLVGNVLINTNSDTEIQVAEAQAFNGFITCSGLNISDLTGIEEFTSITGLECYNNLITSLNLTNNTALMELVTGSNQISTLDLSNNTSLTILFCQNNLLTNLNIANGNNMNFTNINASNNANLTCIEIDNSDTTGYNWFGNPNILFDTGVSFSDNCSGTTSLNEALNLPIINIYPNPTSDKIYFSIQTYIQLTDVTGQIIIDKKNVDSIDIANQPTGIYFLILMNNNGQVIQRNKIVKE